MNSSEDKKPHREAQEQTRTQAMSSLFNAQRFVVITVRPTGEIDVASLGLPYEALGLLQIAEKAFLKQAPLQLNT